MTDTITSRTPTSSKFNEVKIGDAVGFVDGPGVFPTDNIGVVTGFGQDRFYDFVSVIRPDGSRDKVVSFTTIGIGIYHLPTHLATRGLFA